MKTTKKILAKILSLMDKMIVTENFYIPDISSSTYYVSVSKDITKAGYTPIALSYVNLNTAIYHVYSMAVRGSNAAFAVSRHQTSGTIAGLSISFTVVYIRSDLI